MSTDCSLIDLCFDQVNGFREHWPENADDLSGRNGQVARHDTTLLDLSVAIQFLYVQYTCLRVVWHTRKRDGVLLIFRVEMVLDVVLEVLLCCAESFWLLGGQRVVHNFT